MFIVFKYLDILDLSFNIEYALNLHYCYYYYYIYFKHQYKCYNYIQHNEY